MSRRVIVLLVLSIVAYACGGSDDADSGTSATEATVATTEAPTSTSAATTEATTTEATTTTQASTTSEATTTTVAATGGDGSLQITAVVFGDRVTLTNGSGADVSLDGLWLCNRPAYLPLSGSLAPGESVDIAAGDLGGLGDGGGEVALYTSNNFGSAADLTDYVAWGTGGGRGTVAEDAGLWAAGDSAPNDGTGITREDPAAGAASWISG